MQWLQHIKDTPVAELEDVWVERAGRVRQCLVNCVCAHTHQDKKLFATVEQPSVMQLLCATIIELLQQAHTHVTSSSRAAEPGRTGRMLLDLLNSLAHPMNCAQPVTDSIVQVFKTTGESSAVPTTVHLHMHAAASLQLCT
jgi:hypothetical protein